MPRRCLHGVHPFPYFAVQAEKTLCLGAACTGCIWRHARGNRRTCSLPRRCLHGVHPSISIAASKCITLCLGAACTGCIWGRVFDRIPIFLCLGAACTGCICNRHYGITLKALCLGAACTGCIARTPLAPASDLTLPRRCLHGVHPMGVYCTAPSPFFASALPARGASPPARRRVTAGALCLGAACTGCICQAQGQARSRAALPRRCLHGVHRMLIHRGRQPPQCFASALPARGASSGVLHLARAFNFASALPARGASWTRRDGGTLNDLCLGAACTGCIGKSRQIAAHHFVAYAVSR